MNTQFVDAIGGQQDQTLVSASPQRQRSRLEECNHKPHLMLHENANAGCVRQPHFKGTHLVFTGDIDAKPHELSSRQLLARPSLATGADLDWNRSIGPLKTLGLRRALLARQERCWRREHSGGSVLDVHM